MQINADEPFKIILKGQYNKNWQTGDEKRSVRERGGGRVSEREVDMQKVRRK